MMRAEIRRHGERAVGFLNASLAAICLRTAPFFAPPCQLGRPGGMAFTVSTRRPVASQLILHDRLTEMLHPSDGTRPLPHLKPNDSPASPASLPFETHYSLVTFAKPTRSHHQLHSSFLFLVPDIAKARGEGGPSSMPLSIHRRYVIPLNTYAALVNTVTSRRAGSCNHD
jgi:hypothetical protein